MFQAVQTNAIDKALLGNELFELNKQSECVRPEQPGTAQDAGGYLWELKGVSNARIATQ
jgi:hypothetical protein